MKELDSPRHDVLRRMIKERRQKADMSQTELAEKLGRGQTFVSAVERGQLG
jgi:ribosome-binding protein aMBF1 (putative translation factor)